MKITLCGSARFEEYFKFWNEMLSIYGHTVYTLSVYPSQKEAGKNWYSEEEKKTLDKVHLNKIRNSEAILVINPFAYIGESTLKEIKFAESTGKKIFCLESWGQGNGLSDCHFNHYLKLAEYFKVPKYFPSPIKTSCYAGITHPTILGGASDIRSKIFTLEKLFKVSLYDKAGIEVDITKL